jgi:hypothetical protein
VLASKFSEDAFEPNDYQTFAERIPLNKNIRAVLNAQTDRDWYKLNVPDAGEVELTVRTFSALKWKISDGKKIYGPFLGNRKVKFELQQKGMRFMVFPDAESLKKLRFVKMQYVIQANFRINSDRMEPNDRAEQAYTIPLKTSNFKATMHGMIDPDWYKVEVIQDGLMTINIHPWSERIDPVLVIRKSNEKPWRTDQGAAGRDEVKAPIILG